MKKFLWSLLAVLLCAVACDKYDDSALNSRIDSLEQRLSALDVVLKAYQNNLFIKTVQETAEGYVITFSDGSVATIANGKDGEKGGSGETLIQSMTVDQNEVTFVLTDGTTFSIPLYSALSIEFEAEDLVQIAANSTREIRYTIQNRLPELTIEALSSADIKAEIVRESATTGKLRIYTGESLDAFSRVVVLVSNGVNTLMKSFSFEQATLKVTDANEFMVSSEAQQLEVRVTTSTDYEVSIPEAVQSWIEHIDTRAERTETLVFSVQKNEGSAARTASIALKNTKFGLQATIRIKQDTNILVTDMVAAFPDPIFRDYVLTNFDTNRDGQLSVAEALAVTRIDVDGTYESWQAGEGITSLKGIEYFTNLQTLYCYYNQLTALDVTQNPALENLSCESNQLTALVTQNPKLERLSCYDNQLTELDVTQNPALSWLGCSRNQLTSLDVTQNSALIALSCECNQLTALDVTQNPKLERLSCYDNQLTELDVTQNPKLDWLWCYNNQLTSLDVTQNSALIALYCECNQLTSLDVTQNPALEVLDCYNNQLTELDVTQNSALDRLWCTDNQLTALDVTQNPALEWLLCFRNQLTSLDVTHNPALEVLACTNNQLTSLDVTQNPALKNLSCFSNQLTALDVTQNPALKYLSCDNNQLTSLDVTQNPVLEHLSCGNDQLTSLDVTQNPVLEYLYCSNNQLMELDVTQNPALEELKCYSNQLTELDLSKTNLGNSPYNDATQYPSTWPLDCASMPTLKTVYLKKGWSIRNITEDNGRSNRFIPDETEIVFVD